MPSIESLGHALVYKVSENRKFPSDLVRSPQQLSFRTEIRALEGMQKEAVVYDPASGDVWRLVSDEGPYLNGTDLAPFPLGFYTTGMAFSFMSELQRHAKAHDIDIKSLSLTQDNYYTMEGSAIRGDMTAGAKPVDLMVRLEADAPQETIEKLVRMSEASSPAHAYMRNLHESAFSLSVNGRELPVTPCAPSPIPLHDDPSAGFDELKPRAESEYLPEIITKLEAAEAVHGVAGGAGSSLQAEQKRTLHVRGEARLREDGLKEIELHLFKPLGSTFCLISDDSPEMGESQKAPPALAYLTAGIGFCFMTQLGRYAHIMKQELESYRIVQDNVFNFEGTAEDWSLVANCQGVDTHLFVDFDEPDEAGQQLVKMGQQTCFLHAAMGSTLQSNLGVEANGTQLTF